MNYVEYGVYLSGLIFSAKRYCFSPVLCRLFALVAINSFQQPLSYTALAYLKLFLFLNSK